MKGVKLTLFLFKLIVWWSILISSMDKNDTHSYLELQDIHQETIIRENELNEIKLTRDTVDDHNQEYCYNTEDLKKICHDHINEFIWKCPTISDSEVEIVKFRKIYDASGFSISAWYFKSINKIDVFKMDPRTFVHQIQFRINIDEQKISLDRLYPTYPEISGFEILQFITNLAFHCKFFIHVLDFSDISTVYSALYGKSYYEYHFEGIDLSQNFLFQKIVVKKKTFLDCFEEKIRNFTTRLSELFYENIQTCKNALMPVEFCPVTFDTQRFFYEKALNNCIDWSPIGGFPQTTHNFYQKFKILPEDLTRIMTKKKKSADMNFVKIDKNRIKTYDEIKTQIFDTSLLMKLFSNIFELCFLELEKRKFDINPEDIFKIYLRPCVMPNINLFLKYHTADI